MVYKIPADDLKVYLWEDDLLDVNPTTYEWRNTTPVTWEQAYELMDRLNRCFTPYKHAKIERMLDYPMSVYIPNECTVYLLEEHLYAQVICHEFAHHIMLNPINFELFDDPTHHGASWVTIYCILLVITCGHSLTEVLASLVKHNIPHFPDTIERTYNAWKKL